MVTQEWRHTYTRAASSFELPRAVNWLLELDYYLRLYV